MNDKQELEDWVRRTIGTPEFQQLVDESHRDGELPAELIARFHARLLSAQEMEIVARYISLNEANLKELVELEKDIEQAARLPRKNWLGSVFVAMTQMFSTPTLRGYSAVVAMLIVVAVSGRYAYMRFVNAPPEVGAPHYSMLLEAQMGAPEEASFELPWGASIERVDREWKVVRPTGEVSSIVWFAWSPLERAVAYRVTLFAESGVELYRSDSVEKPFVKLPREVLRRLDPGTDYLWLVEASMQPPTEPIRTVGSFTLK